MAALNNNSNHKWIAHLLVLVGLLSCTTKNLSAQSKSAEEYLKLALEQYDVRPDSSYQLCLLAEKVATSAEQIDVCACKAKIHLLFTDYDEAEYQIGKAIVLAKEQKNFKSLSYVLSLKSILHERLGEHDLSHYAQLEAYQISKEHASAASQYSRLSNLTGSYLRRNLLDSAAIFFDEMQKLNSGGEINEESTYYFYQNKGRYFLYLKEYEVAIEYYHKAEKIAKLYEKTDSEATILMLMAEAYMKLGELAKAEEIGYHSYAFSQANNLIYEKAEALDILIQIMQEKKDYLTAFNLQKELMEVENEIFNLDKLAKVKAVEAKLALTEKEKEIAQKNLDIEEAKVLSAQAEVKTQRLYWVIVVILGLMIFVVFIYWRTRTLNRLIKQQKITVELKNKEILDSINYAKRIQEAILPGKDTLTTYLNNGFVLFKPKDVVSGDFYWLEEYQGAIYLAVADCTGHGVPGALVSVICSNALSKALLEEGITNPGHLLDRTRDLVIQRFEKSGENVKDGMDISLLALPLIYSLGAESEIQTLELNSARKQHLSLVSEKGATQAHAVMWSGANNPLWVIRKDSAVVEEIKPDKQPIGKYAGEHSFTTHNLELYEGDTVYLFSDGYQDQFGGEKGKKFKPSQLKELFLSLRNTPMEKQKEIIDKVFEEWRGDLEQLDDVCIIGLRI
jgi:tetratricopeptide (TPR) repeat protein